MDEIEEIKRRKLAELQKRYEEELKRKEEEEKIKEQIETTLRILLTVDAWDQWNNAKIANPENAYTAAVAIVNSAREGRIKGKVTKEQLKQILRKVASSTRVNWKIIRK